MNPIQALYEIFLQYPAVSTDTRHILPGSIFFALKGPRFDGNAFALEALEKGAAWCVVDDPGIPENPRFFRVENTLAALQQLATHHRRQFTIPVIGITGSNGKTTTKELVSAVLSSHYHLLFTQGNLNNHIGVPLTLLRLKPGIEMAVIEMGANKVGDIAELSAIAEPTHGLITNIGKAHLEGFGGIEGVKKGKAELYRFLEAIDGVVFLNKDEAFLEELASANRRIVFYGRVDQLTGVAGLFEIQLLEELPFLRVAFLSPLGEPVSVDSQLIGLYNFGNIATAIAIGKYFKVPPAKIRSAIEGYAPTNNRSQLKPWGSNTLVLDAYNANPTSMRHALATFAKLPAQKRMAIIGDMLELGPESEKEHRDMLAFAQSLALDQLVAYGPQFEVAAREAGVLHFQTLDDLAAWLAAQKPQRTHILLKASRGIALERLLESIPQ